MACNRNDYVIHFRDGALYLIDGAGTSLTIPLEMDDVNNSGLNGDMSEVSVNRSRRKTVTAGTGDVLDVTHTTGTYDHALIAAGRS